MRRFSSATRLCCLGLLTAACASGADLPTGTHKAVTQGGHTRPRGPRFKMQIKEQGAERARRTQVRRSERSDAVTQRCAQSGGSRQGLPLDFGVGADAREPTIGLGARHGLIAAQDNALVIDVNGPTDVLVAGKRQADVVDGALCVAIDQAHIEPGVSLRALPDK